MNNDTKQKEIGREIAELERKLVYKKKVLKRLKSVNENGRYFLRSDGTIGELIPTINNEIWENSIKQGNTFKMIEDAEKERDRRALLYEFNQFKNERNNGWTPDWNDHSKGKYCISIFKNKLGTFVNHTTDTIPKFGYFNTDSNCERAIQIFGKRILELYAD